MNWAIKVVLKWCIETSVQLKVGLFCCALFFLLSTTDMHRQMEQRLNIKFIMKLGKNSQEIHEMLRVVNGDNALKKKPLFPEKLRSNFQFFLKGSQIKVILFVLLIHSVVHHDFILKNKQWMHLSTCRFSSAWGIVFVVYN